MNVEKLLRSLVNTLFIFLIISIVTFLVGLLYKLVGALVFISVANYDLVIWKKIGE